MESAFKPNLLPPKTVSMLDKQSSAKSKELKVIGKRIASRVKGSKSLGAPVSARSMSISVDDLLKRGGVKLLVDFGLPKDAATYAISVVKKEATADSTRRTGRRPVSRIVLPKLFTVHCAAFKDGTCGCEVTWKGGGMSCGCGVFGIKR